MVSASEIWAGVREPVLLFLIVMAASFWVMALYSSFPPGVSAVGSGRPKAPDAEASVGDELILPSSAVYSDGLIIYRSTPSTTIKRPVATYTGPLPPADKPKPKRRS